MGDICFLFEAEDLSGRQELDTRCTVHQICLAYDEFRFQVINSRGATS